MNEFYAENWTNDIGQELKPGDKVIAVASGYGHSVNVRLATYLGVRKNSEGKVEGVNIKYEKPKYSWSSQQLNSYLPKKRVYRITE